MIKKKLRCQLRQFCFLIMFFLFAVSCKREDVYLYDKTGFVPPKTYSPPVQYPPQYVPYYRPDSRSYQNPYSQPPRNYYPYYDSDQYYVPPSYYYNNVEPDHGIDPNIKY